MDQVRAGPLLDTAAQPQITVGPHVSQVPYDIRRRLVERQNLVGCQVTGVPILELLVKNRGLLPESITFGLNVDG